MAGSFLGRLDRSSSEPTNPDEAPMATPVRVTPELSIDPGAQVSTNKPAIVESGHTTRDLDDDPFGEPESIEAS
jgi:hypothetical protein